MFECNTCFREMISCLVSCQIPVAERQHLSFDCDLRTKQHILLHNRFLKVCSMAAAYSYRKIHNIYLCMRRKALNCGRTQQRKCSVCNGVHRYQPTISQSTIRDTIEKMFCLQVTKVQFWRKITFYGHYMQCHDTLSQIVQITVLN